MNWLSETAVLWLPKQRHAYPQDFAEAEREPWVYLLEEQRLIPPEQIRSLRTDWEDEMTPLGATLPRWTAMSLCYPLDLGCLCLTTGKMERPSLPAMVTKMTPSK